METINRAVLYLAVIETMLEALHGIDVDKTELVDSLAILGFDPTEVLYDTNTIKAFQLVCRKFSELELTEDDLARFLKE